MKANLIVQPDTPELRKLLILLYKLLPDERSEEIIPYLASDFYFGMTLHL